MKILQLPALIAFWLAFAAMMILITTAQCAAVVVGFFGRCAGIGTDALAPAHKRRGESP